MGSQGTVGFQRETFPATSQAAPWGDGFSSGVVSTPSLGVVEQGPLFRCEGLDWKVSGGPRLSGSKSCEQPEVCRPQKMEAVLRAQDEALGRRSRRFRALVSAPSFPSPQVASTEQVTPSVLLAGSTVWGQL